MPTPPRPGLGRSTRRRATSRPPNHRQHPRPTRRPSSRVRAAIPASVWPPPLPPVDPDAAWPEPILERLITTLSAPGDRIALIASDGSPAELPGPIYGTAARAVVPPGTLAAAAETIEAHDRRRYLAARGNGTGGQHAVPYWARFVHPTPAGSAAHTTTGSSAEPDLEDLGAPPLSGHSRAAGSAALVVAAVGPEGVGEAFGTVAAELLRPGGTAQRSPAVQRKGHYTADSTAHPAKMLPAIAARAIARYTEPGDLVVDPMCGIGTTLVEAVRTGRRAFGVEYEQRWADIARANLDLARADGHTAEATVLRGDARHLAATVPDELVGQAALVVTSPPYGPSAHGQIKAIPGGGVHKHDYTYGDMLDRGNLANTGQHRLLSGFTRILAGCARLLRPGGHVVITARPWREHGELVDLPSQIEACGARAGLVPVERCVALLARVADDDLVPRASFFARDNIVKHRAAGLPLHLVVHEDVLVLQLDPAPTTSPTAIRRPGTRPAHDPAATGDPGTPAIPHGTGE